LQARPRITRGGLHKEIIMSPATTILAAAVAAAALASPAFADFQYQGSPKFGEFYIYTSTQVSRPDTMARQSPLNANGAMMNHKASFKGGIGNRAP
jgi:hypothetical protein